MMIVMRNVLICLKSCMAKPKGSEDWVQRPWISVLWPWEGLKDSGSSGCSHGISVPVPSYLKKQVEGFQTGTDPPCLSVEHVSLPQIVIFTAK